MAINNLKDSKPSQAVIEGFKKFNEMWEADTIEYLKMNKEKSEIKPELIKSISFVDKIGDKPSKKYDVNAKYQKKIKTAIIFIPNND